MGWLNSLRGVQAGVGDDNPDPAHKPEKEFKLPEDVQKKLDSIDTMKSELENAKGQLKVLESNRNNQQQQRQEPVKQEPYKPKYTANPDEEANKVSGLIYDPDQAITERLLMINQPLINSQINLASRNLADQLLGEREYYYGETKNEVDRMIASMSMNQRDNPEAIENCYLIVMGKKLEDINTGKLKSRSSLALTSGSGTGAPDTSKTKNDNIKLDDYETEIAKALGIKPEKYLEDKKREVEYV